MHSFFVFSQPHNHAGYHEKLSQCDFMNSYWFLIILSSLKPSKLEFKFMVEFKLTNEPLFWNNNPFPPFLHVRPTFIHCKGPGSSSLSVGQPSNVRFLPASWQVMCLEFMLLHDLDSAYLPRVSWVSSVLQGISQHTTCLCIFVHIVSSTMNTVSPFISIRGNLTYSFFLIHLNYTY